MSMYPTIDEFECPRYKCKDCVHFKFVTPQNPHGCNRRFDHSKMEYAHPWFVNVPEERGFPCSDFEPNGSYLAALLYWHGFEHWREWMPDNPYNFPVAYVSGKKFNNDIIPADAIPCTGKCYECQSCWQLRKGQSVCFHKH